MHKRVFELCCLLAIAASAAPALGQVSVPYSFTPGSLIQSAQVNADFQALVAGINTPNGTAYVLNGCCTTQQTGGFNLSGPAVLGTLGGATPDILTIGVASTGTQVQGATIVGTAHDFGLKLFNHGAGGNEWLIDTTSNGTAYPAGSLVFLTNYSAGWPVPVMLMTGGGLVGIGTVSPSDSLDVNIGNAGPVNAGITIEGSTSSYGDLGLKITNTGAGGSTWFIDSTNSGSGYGPGSLAFVNGLGATPILRFDSFGIVNFQTEAIRMTGASQPQLVITETASNSAWLITNDGGALTIFGSGNVGIKTLTPDASLTVNGTADKPGGGSWGTFSDERLKDIKGGYRRGLREVMQLDPIRYEYKKDNALGLAATGEHIGLGAQAVEKVIPEAVSQNDRGYRILDNDPIIWTMLNAIKEQQRTLESQQQQIELLQAELRAQCASPQEGSAARSPLVSHP
jgi:hypothetical protein